jgi:hypothetical protein
LCEAGEVLVLSCDGKGVVMRPAALRPATAKAATSRKLATRLSKGEQRHRKRLAEVGCVYDCAPIPRTPGEVLPAPDQPHPPGRTGPRARGKWLVASVTVDAARVIGQVFDEAERRDPDQHRTWVALVDGNNHQLARVGTEAQARGVDVAIVVDFVHVLEYLWWPLGAASPRATLPPRPGCMIMPGRSWTDASASSLRRSAARPPATTWTPPSASPPTPPPPTCLAARWGGHRVVTNTPGWVRAAAGP